jgi:hypothetical protein
VRAWSMLPRYKCCSTISCGNVHVVPFGSTAGFSAHAEGYDDSAPRCGSRNQVAIGRSRHRLEWDIPLFSRCSTMAKPPTTPFAAP